MNTYYYLVSRDYDKILGKMKMENVPYELKIKEIDGVEEVIINCGVCGKDMIVTLDIDRAEKLPDKNENDTQICYLKTVEESEVLDGKIVCMECFGRD
jgi:hypothetical protein